MRTYRVHFADLKKVERKVKFNGEDVTAVMPGYEVELAPLGHDGGHVRLLYVGKDEIEAASSIFAKAHADGLPIVASFAVGDKVEG